MNTQSGNKIKLGFFVLAATALFILAFYFIGSKKNIFQSTIHVSAVFNNVNGLLPGNNVRFNGINVGTVSKVEAIADTAIKVEFTIEKNIAKFIAVNSVVSIGTDGLLGNKVVNIAPAEQKGNPVQEGSEFDALHSIQMEDAMRTLNRTNSNIEFITRDLKNIAQKINNNNSLWGLLSDTVVAQNVKAVIVNIRTTSNQSAIMTGNLKSLTNDLKMGKGSLGAFITDTSLYGKLKQVVVKFEKVSDSVALISGNIAQLTKNIKDGKGSAGMFLKDTMLIHDLNKSMENIKEGSKGFNENMEALKHNILLRRYFKNQARNKLK